MKLRSKLLALFFYASLSLTVFAAVDHEPDIKMGPILHFNGQNENLWHVSALFLLKQRPAAHPSLVFGDEYSRLEISGDILGSKYGYDFVRYDMHVRQTNRTRHIDYGLPNDKIYRYVTPALGQTHRFLYHSCNGYQRKTDRKKVGGITPMWQEIKERHRQKPYFFQLGGGDQLYADGIISEDSNCSLEPRVGETYGVFALATLQPWIRQKERLGFAEFTDEMALEVDRFYFNHYIEHYNLPGFREVMAMIPSIAQPDDHDFFDGCGSYPYFLQNSFVMEGIRTIGMWYAFTIQHQITADSYLKTKTSLATPYHFSYVVNDGKVAIFGVDTRTERTRDQVLSQNEWDKIFAHLDQLNDKVEHLIFMLGIPVVYASSESLDKALKSADTLPLASTLLSHLPCVGDVFKKNAFALFEIDDDLHDGWSHPNHQQERNDMVKKLQTFADKKGIRVNIISGDVHLGGFGTIVKDNKPSWANDSIAQIISSPVGNITPSKATAHFLAARGCELQKIGDDSHMCLHKLRHKKNDREKSHGLVAHRNFVTLELTPRAELAVEWSAESKSLKDHHKLYYVNIPPAEK